MPSLTTTLREELERIRAAGRYRRRRVIAGAHGVLLQVDGQLLVNFCSNDYLGLSTHPELVAALSAAAQQTGVGSGAAQLITGYNAEHAALEQELAEYVQRPRALLLSTGYQGNMGVIASLVGKADAIFSDQLNHASLIDGCRLSGAQVHRYAHADAAAMETPLAAATTGRKLIVTDAVFSMDGDCAPLAALAKAAQRHDAWLMVDDAHGLGTTGPQGRGSVVAAGLGVDEVPIYTATLGKSLGGFGAFVAGSEDLIDYCINAQRTFIFTTAPPPAVAAAARVGLRLARTEQWRRQQLQDLIARFRERALRKGLPVSDSITPIQPLIVGAETRALALSASLQEAGYLVSAIRPPTVAPGTSRLRITLSTAHNHAQVDGLVDALSGAWERLPP